MATNLIPPDSNERLPFIGLGVQDLGLEVTVENESTKARTQVIGVMFPFPRQLNGIRPSDIEGDYHLQIKGTSTSLPTSWTVMAIWSNGNIRWAKGWTEISVPATTTYTLELIFDTGLSLPTYSQHANVTFPFFKSEVTDIFGNTYILDLTDTGSWEVNETVESTAWMRVFRRRAFHPTPGSGTNVLSRDLFSATWYLYIPHNSRFVDLEIRLGNDYKGNDNGIISNAILNDFPLGSIGYGDWKVKFDTTIQTSWEAQSGFKITGPVFDSGENSNAWTVTSQAIPKATGTAYNFDEEYLADGASVSRLVRLYFNAGTPTTAEDDTWDAIQDTASLGHPLAPIPTLKTVAKTEAAGLYGSRYKFFSTSNQASAQTEASTRWNSGLFQLSRGSRGSLGWEEHLEEAAGNIGLDAPRNGMDQASLTYFSQDWRAVRFFYSAGLQALIRPGRLFWGLETSYRRAEVDIDLDMGPLDPTGQPLPLSTNKLLRQYRKSFGGKASATNGDATVIVDEGVGELNFWFYNGLGFQTETSAGSFASGYRRIFVEGDTTARLVLSIDAAVGSLTMDGNYGGSTGSKKRFALSNDPDTSFATVPSNDQRDYIKHRLNVQDWNKQYLYTAEAITHTSNCVQFEAWQQTGSWALLDGVLAHAEILMGTFRDTAGGGGSGHLAGQVISNGWWLQGMLQGLQVARQIVPARADKYQDAIIGRVTERIHTDWAPKGAYKEASKVAIKNILAARLDPDIWGDSNLIGAKDTAGVSTWRIKFGNGFHYSPVFEVSANSAHFWAAWVELKDASPAVITKLLEVAQGHSDFLIDYCLIPDTTNSGKAPLLRSPQFTTQFFPTVTTGQGSSLAYYTRLASTDLVRSSGDEFDKLGVSVPGTLPPTTAWSQFVEPGLPSFPEDVLACPPPDLADEDSFACFVPPEKLGSFVLGDIGAKGTNLWAITGFSLAFRYHTSVAKQIQYGNLLKEWYNSLVTQGVELEIKRGTSRLVVAATGDAPFDVGPAEGWWDLEFTTRKRILGDTLHSGYTTNDVLTFQLPADLLAASLADGLTDVRVVYQDEDLTFQEVGVTIRHRTVADTRYIFFKPVVAIPAAQDIGVQTTFAYYVYYANATPPDPTATYNNGGLISGTNPFVSTDGPITKVDVDQSYIWDQEGSLLHDASNLGLEPTLIGAVALIDGPHGGAADFDGATGLLGRSGFNQIFREVGAYSIDFYARVDTAELAAAADSWVLCSFWGSERPIWVAILSSFSGVGTDQIRIELIIGGAVVPIEVPTADYPKDQWFHLGISYDGAFASVSVDGTVISTADASGLTPRPTNQDRFVFGSWDLFGIGFFPGDLYQMSFRSFSRVWGSVATPTTITLGFTEVATPTTLDLNLTTTAVIQVLTDENLASAAAIGTPDLNLNLTSAGVVAIQNDLNLTSASAIKVLDRVVLSSSLEPFTTSVVVMQMREQALTTNVVVLEEKVQNLTSTSLIAIETNENLTANSLIAIQTDLNLTADSAILATGLDQNLLSGGVIQTEDNPANNITTAGAIQVPGLEEDLVSGVALRVTLETSMFAGGLIAETAQRNLETVGAIAVPTDANLTTDSSIVLFADLQALLTSSAVVQRLGKEQDLIVSAFIALFTGRSQAVLASGVISVPGALNLGTSGFVALITFASLDTDVAIATSKPVDVTTDSAIRVLGLDTLLTAGAGIATTPPGTVLEAGANIVVADSITMASGGGISIVNKVLNMGSDGFIADLDEDTVLTIVDKVTLIAGPRR